MPEVITNTVPYKSDRSSRTSTDASEVNVFVLAWSAEEPLRVGELAILDPSAGKQVLGRGDEETRAGERIRFFQQRPGTLTLCPALAGAGLSRSQLLVETTDEAVKVENRGQCKLHVNGVRCEEAVVRPGDVISLRRQLVLLCGRRIRMIPESRHFHRKWWGTFGEPDAFGILGESPATWALREELALVAKTPLHALLVGPSGTGKELAARAIHAMSDRASKRFVARSAATIPEGLIDAELFGSAKNYPNPGQERPGLVGAAHGGTLFLDEITEMPSELQAHLLRVLDEDGDYQRLGEETKRRSDFRLVAATNRGVSALKHDLNARLTKTIELSALASRREDIPLFAKHLLLKAAQKSPDPAARFVGQDGQGRAYARLAPDFIEHVLGQEFATNTRQLDVVIWKAIGESRGDEMRAPQDSQREPVVAERGPKWTRKAPSILPTVEQIRAALDKAGGSVEKAARALGLPSRFVLYRLMRKNHIGEGE